MKNQLKKSEKLLLKQLDSLSQGVQQSTAILANASALLNQYLLDINWVGFYLYNDDRLTLGPFQGKQACINIFIGTGVCGTAASTNKTIRVNNVHEFEGHIACDQNSQSEIVIPIYKNKKLFGVLDIDSPNINRFTIEDQILLESFALRLEKHL